MFRALRFRNFRWFILSQGCSLMGSWMQQVALAWLVYRITGSGLALGISGSLSTLPSVFVAPMAGVLADRFDRRRIVMTMQTLTVIQSVILALLVWTNSASITVLFALSVTNGLIQGFDWPTRQSLVVHLVAEQKDLGNAIALNSTVYNFARVVGPSLAGAILALGGDSLCFALNGLCCGLALLFVTQVRTPASSCAPEKIQFFREFADGAAYIWREPDVRRNIALVALASGSIMPYTALLPIFAAKTFGGGAQLFAFLAAVPAVGAIAGGLLLASRRTTIGLSWQIRVVGAIASTALVVFALSSWLPLSIAALLLLGGAMMLWTSSINTQLQMAIPEAKRGRVMGFFSIALMGGLPIGYMIYGTLTAHFGAAATVSLGGIVGFIGNLWFNRASLPRSVLWLRRKPS